MEGKLIFFYKKTDHRNYVYKIIYSRGRKVKTDTAGKMDASNKCIKMVIFKKSTMQHPNLKLKNTFENIFGIELNELSWSLMKKLAKEQEWKQY